MNPKQSLFQYSNSIRIRIWIRTILILATPSMCLCFAFVSLAKISEWTRFVDSLESFRMLPAWAIEPLAIIIPAAELLPIAAWIAHRPRLAASISLLRLVTFTSAVFLH